MTRSLAGNGARDITLKQLIAFALPALPVAALQLPFVIIIPAYYASEIGLELGTIGLVIIAVRILDAILDPLIGYGADHFRPRWGRRRAWFAAAVMPVTIGALLVFNPIVDVDTANTWFWIGWLFLTSAMMSLGYTALSLSHQSWAAELAPSYYGRNRIFAAREVMIVVGTLVATGLPFVLSQLGFVGDRPVLIGLSILVGVTLPLFALLTVLTVPEPRDTTYHPLKFFASLKGMAANKPFLRLVAAFAISNMANGVPAALLVYFVRDYVRGGEDLQRFFLLLYFLAGVLSTPLWLWLSRRTSKHRAWCVAMLLACSAFVWMPFVGAHIIGSASVVVFGILMVVAGLAVGADLMLPPSIQADVIDVDTARSGEQHTGFYFAIWALATKVGLAIALGLSLVLLQQVGGFRATVKNQLDPAEQFQQIQPIPSAEAPAVSTRPAVPPAATEAEPRRRTRLAKRDDHDPVPQSTRALWTLAILYAWVPVLLKLFAVWLMWRFPIGAAEQARLRAEIDAHVRAEGIVVPAGAERVR